MLRYPRSHLVKLGVKFMHGFVQGRCLVRIGECRAIEPLSEGTLIIRTNRFDRRTVEAVKKLQARYNLPVDSVIGPATAMALYAEERKAPSL